MCGETTLGVVFCRENGFLKGERGMDLVDGADGAGEPRIMPQIGFNHQATMPPLKQSARIASLEYLNRDQWYAFGLPLPVTYIAPPWPLRKCKSTTYHEKNASLASTSNSCSGALQFGQQQKMEILCSDDVVAKDANSCASSSKEASHMWKKEEEVDGNRATRSDGKAEEDEPMVDDVPGVSGQSELKSSITSVAAQGSMLMKKKKKKRSCWQTLKRRGNKKSRTEKARKDKRWSPLHGEMVGGAGGGGSARKHSWEAVAPGEICRIFPGDDPSDSWREEEVSAFILALFLFGKDFGRIERFLENKKMIDIVHFYYGDFYRTPAFCRWAGSKNGRSRKYVHGPLVLQGWRQDELLRRLRPHFSDAARDGVEEAVQSFNDRELTVEAVMEELKAAVGMGVLVRCIGIGQPKRDLTAVHGDSAKHGGYYPASGRVEGKACSLLTKEETLERLCGDMRISKTRTNDLFWEAVWPRLLARGWQSMECEMPGSMQLVFLRPGVSKVIRGVSEKGLHYFDAVSDVLKAVANNPRLLDGSELSEDHMEGSEDQEEEDGHGWSDDMFETLDMHRPRATTRVTEGKVEVVAACNTQVAAAFKVSSSSDEQAAQESSESSSVDIDLNRPLPAVLKSELDEVEEEGMAHVDGNRSPKVAATPVVVQASTSQRHRFSIEDIDLNLPPADDLDCNSPDFTEPDSVDERPFHLRDGRSNVLTDASESNVFTTACSAPNSESGRLPKKMESFNLNDPLPMFDMAMGDDGGFNYVIEFPEHQPQDIVAPGSAAGECSRPWNSTMLFSKEEGCASCSREEDSLSPGGLGSRCRCKSRKRSFAQLTEIDLERQPEHVGRELVPVSKKRVRQCDFPFHLDGIGTPGLLFIIQMEAFAKMDNWSGMSGIQSFTGEFLGLDMHGLRYHWPWSMLEKIAPITKPQLPKQRVAEMDDDAEKVNELENVETAGADTLAEVQYKTTVSTLNGAKRLKCHLTEGPVYSSNLRSKSQRLPRKFSVSFHSGSGNNLLKDAEIFPDRSGNRERTHRRGGFTNLSSGTCALNSHGSQTAEDGVLEDVKRIDSSNSETSGDSRFLCTESQTCSTGRRTQGGFGSGGRRITAGSTKNVKENVAEIDSARALLSALKGPSLSATSPPAEDASCSPSDELPRPIPGSRGIRSSSNRAFQITGAAKNGSERSLLHILPGKRRSSSTSDILDFEATPKRVKVDHPTYSLRNNSSRSREITEHEVSATLCSLQEHVVDRAVTRKSHGVTVHKLKGKRSLRLRRRNFTSFKEFIFGDGCHHLDEVEDGLFVQTCTSNGPFQPTGQLPTPTAEKTPRSSKRRRRRSDLPSRASCVAASPTIHPVASGSKGGGGGGSGSSTPKGQGPSRVPGGQNVTAQEEEPALPKRPLHDVRFSIRRTVSDTAAKPAERQSSRKVPARWNQFSVC